MRTLGTICLKDNQRRAVLEVDRILKDRFSVARTIVFGSVARGEANNDSDLDLLVITTEQISPETRAEISKLVFAINLQHDTLISTVVVNGASWNGGIMSETQLHKEVERDGVPV